MTLQLIMIELWAIVNSIFWTGNNLSAYLIGYNTIHIYMTSYLIIL